METNRQQRLRAVDLLQQTLKILKGKTIGLLGLTFKPHTDDLRDAPALDMIAELLRLGAKVKAFDPIYANGGHPSLPGAVELCQNPEQLAATCDALVVVTDWPEFRQLNYADLAAQMRTPLLVDGRNHLEPAAIVNAGLVYIGIGRGQNHPVMLTPRRGSPNRPSRLVQSGKSSVS